MDKVGYWRRVHQTLWRQPAFRKLTTAQRLVVLYILTGPQQNRCGFGPFSPAMAAEDLDLDVNVFNSDFAQVCKSMRFEWDAAARVLFLPQWWRFNRPDSRNVMVGNLKDLKGMLPTPLLARFLGQGELLDAAYRQYLQKFGEGSGKVRGRVQGRFGEGFEEGSAKDEDRRPKTENRKIRARARDRGR